VANDNSFVLGFFVIINCHFVVMGLICIGLSPYFSFFFGLCLFALSFALYFDGWVLDFYI